MSGQPIIKLVRIAARPGKAAELRAALSDLERATVEEPGDVAFTFFQALRDDESFVLPEEFVDRAAMEAHLAAPHMQSYLALDLTSSVRPIDVPAIDTDVSI